MADPRLFRSLVKVGGPSSGGMGLKDVSELPGEEPGEGVPGRGVSLLQGTLRPIVQTLNLGFGEDASQTMSVSAGI